MTEHRCKLLLAVALAAAATSAACRKGDNIGCDAVVARYISNVEGVVEREIADERERKLITTGLPGLRERLIVSCRELPWSEVSRRCIAEAVSADELEKCNPFGDQAPPP